jgi:hypothetical protein
MRRERTKKGSFRFHRPGAVWYTVIMSTTTMDFEPSIVERLVVSPNAAEAILSLEFKDPDRQRMRELADKNNKGTITDDEKVEMEGYRRVGTFLALMQSKARLTLKRASGTSVQG